MLYMYLYCYLCQVCARQMDVYIYFHTVLAVAWGHYIFICHTGYALIHFLSQTRIFTRFTIIVNMFATYCNTVFEAIVNNKHICTLYNVYS